MLHVDCDTRVTDGLAIIDNIRKNVFYYLSNFSTPVALNGKQIKTNQTTFRKFPGLSSVYNQSNQFIRGKEKKKTKSYSPFFLLTKYKFKKKKKRK